VVEQTYSGHAKCLALKLVNLCGIDIIIIFTLTLGKLTKDPLKGTGKFINGFVESFTTNLLIVYISQDELYPGTRPELQS